MSHAVVMDVKNENANGVDEVKDEGISEKGRKLCVRVGGVIKYPNTVVNHILFALFVTDTFTIHIVYTYHINTKYDVTKYRCRFKHIVGTMSSALLTSSYNRIHCYICL